MLDAIIISDSGNDTFSVSSSMRLEVEGRPAVIQNIRNYVRNDGRLVNSMEGETRNNWHHAPKLNGILLLSRLLEKNFKVELVDSYFKERDRFIELLDHKPEVIIISTTFILNKKTLFDLVNDIRSLSEDVCIVVGGPFVYTSYLLYQRRHDDTYDTASPSETYLFMSTDQVPDVDFYIVDNKGLTTLFTALEQIKTRCFQLDLPNIAFWNGNKYIFTPREPRFPEPEDYTVNWNIVPDRYLEFGVSNVQASYGCPFQCEFCNFVKNKADMFVKPLDMLISELQVLQKRGVKYVRFIDDDFRLGRKDLDKVCRAILDADLNLKWMSFFRASTLEKMDFELLKQAGCIEVQIGMESANREVLKNMCKQADPEMYLRIIDKLLTIGINCSCCFLIGFPGETAESAQETLEFIENIPKPHHLGSLSWSIYPFLLVPLSPIYEPARRARYNLTGYLSEWQHTTMDAKTARNWVKMMFNNINNSGPIYSGDDLDMMLSLSPEDKKEFLKIRHRLEKKNQKELLTKSLLLNSFSKVF